MRYALRSPPRSPFGMIAGPTIVSPRLLSVLDDVRRAGRHRELLLRILALLSVGLAMHVAGELLGFACDICLILQGKSAVPCRRIRNVTPVDRLLVSA
jgi:hypothetical protein